VHVACATRVTPDALLKLGALPLAFQATGIESLPFGRRRPRCLDRIGGGTELVGCNMGDRRGLPAAKAACLAAPDSSLAAAMAWPAAVRACGIVISPLAQARPGSIARRHRKGLRRFRTQDETVNGLAALRGHAEPFPTYDDGNGFTVLYGARHRWDGGSFGLPERTEAEKWNPRSTAMTSRISTTRQAGGWRR